MVTGLKDIRYWLIATVAVAVGDVVLQGGKNHADACFVVIVQLMLLLLLELLIYLLAAVVGLLLLRLLCQQGYARCVHSVRDVIIVIDVNGFCG